MTYLGVAPGGLGNHLFMRSPNNVLFTAAQALFDEYLFPRCPTSSARDRHRPSVLDRRYTPPKDSTVLDDDDDQESPSHSHHEPPEKGQDAQHDDAEPQPKAEPPEKQRSPSPPTQLPEQTPPEPTKPWRSERVRRPPAHLRDNAHGQRPPSQLDQDLRRKVGNDRPAKAPTRPVRPPAEQVPGPSSQQQPHPSDHAHTPDAEEAELAELCREGGVGLINYLMAKAVEHDIPQPDVRRVREWT